MKKEKMVFSKVEEKKTYEQLSCHNKILVQANEELRVEVERLITTVRVLSGLIQELSK